MTEQGVEYATFIDAELKGEYDRKSVLDARGLAVVTTSSAFLTLVFATSALVLGKDFEVRPASKGGVIVALVFFVIAGVLGLLANYAREYEVTSIDTLRQMTDGHWTDDEVEARNVCAQRRVKTVATLRDGNSVKAKQITLALGFQLAAIIALSVAVIAEVVRGKAA